LVRVLDIHHQPNVVTNDKAGYFFHEAYLAGALKGYFNKPLGQWTDAEKAEIRDAYQQCLDRIEASSEQARRDNKIKFTKEHAFWFVNPAIMLDAESGTTSGSGEQQEDCFRLAFANVYGQRQTFSRNNKTLLPDEYLRTWQFAFLIRHPALAWPSMYRAMRKISNLGILDDDGINGSFVSNMTFRWTRYLYDWCLEQSKSNGSSVPLILDAHDVIHNQDVVLRFCEETGLDKNAVQFEWKDDNINQLMLRLQNSQNEVSDYEKEANKIMTSTLRTSSGIIKDKTPATVDIEAEVEKWKEEFGPEGAAMIERTVWAAMPDYEYLREKRLKV
jgi:hypothetical protein